MPFEAENPTIITSDTKVYDKWWLDAYAGETQHAGTATQDSKIAVTFKKYRVVGDSYEFSPDPLDTVNFTIAELFQKAQQNAIIAQVLPAFMGGIFQLAAQAGVIDVSGIPVDETVKQLLNPEVVPAAE